MLWLTCLPDLSRLFYTQSSTKMQSYLPGLTLIILVTVVTFNIRNSPLAEIKQKEPPIEPSIVYKNAKTSMKIKLSPGAKSDLTQLLNANSAVVETSPVTTSPPVFVTAVSQNHFEELKAHIPHWINYIKSKEFKTVFPQTPLFIIWSIDSTQEFMHKLNEISELFKNEKIKIKLLKLDFENYPRHIKNLQNYAWKIIINTKMLSQFQRIWWFDSSVKPIKSKFEHLTKLVNETLNSESCFLFPAPGHIHGLSWATCNKTLTFLPVIDEKIWKNKPENKIIPPIGNLPSLTDHVKNANTMEIATSMIQILGSEKCKNEIFKPLYYCALDEKCIAPEGSKLHCRDANILSDCGSACHRYDQSLVNLLVGNFYKFDKTKYTARGILWKNGEITEEKMVSWEHADDLLKINKMKKSKKNVMKIENGN